MSELEKKLAPVKPSLRDLDTELSISPLGIVPTAALGLYLLGMSLVLSYMIYNLWPPQPKGRTVGAQAAEQIANTRKAASQNANSSGATNTNSTTNSQPATNANSNTAADSNTNSRPNTNTSSNSAGAGANDSGKNIGGQSTTDAINQNDPNTASAEMLEPVTLFRGLITFRHSVEVRLLLIALLAGALGAFIHAATSFADFVGNRKLSGSWAWWYLLRPFIGMALALVFYFVVRAGFISPSAGAGDMNPFGIAAMAGLVGMFSKQATDKLSEVFTAVFGAKGDERRGGKLQGPTVTSIDPPKGPTAGGTPVKITGTGFLPDASVTFGGKAATSVIVDSSGKLITAKTPAQEAEAEADVVVANKSGEKATLAKGFKYKSA